MAERREILKSWRRSQDTSAVLATLISVQGSSYRRPGARMYIQPASYAGSISGGCLEGEVARKAAWIARQGAAVQRYSTMYDEDAPQEVREMPYGLGCGGVLDLLLEPVSLPEGQALLTALEAAEKGATFSTATLLPIGASAGQNLARAILHKNISENSGLSNPAFVSTDCDSATKELLIGLASHSTNTELVSARLNGELRNVYVEAILPPQRLVIFGAGDDVQPLVQMAYLLGWRVAVADGRAWLAQAVRFPQADQVLALRRDLSNFDDLRLSADDAIAILTHSFEQDRNLLERLLPLELSYVGLLGARHRSQLLLKEVAETLNWTPEQCLSRVRAPIGLDLGGDSPEAVALSIVAEVEAVLHRKAIAFRSKPAIDMSALPARPYVPAQCPLDQPPEEFLPDTQRQSHAGSIVR
ncbi:MAG TPA: XdhC family protein [Acidobacteriaceae bacterium]|nr:XdhC family protein [Acidobacteriaceae bacterium]